MLVVGYGGTLTCLWLMFLALGGVVLALRGLRDTSVPIVSLSVQVRWGRRYAGEISGVEGWDATRSTDVLSLTSLGLYPLIRLFIIPGKIGRFSQMESILGFIFTIVNKDKVWMKILFCMTGNVTFSNVQ